MAYVPEEPPRSVCLAGQPLDEKYSQYSPYPQPNLPTHYKPGMPENCGIGREVFRIDGC